jgi:hypothetical protein
MPSAVWALSHLSIRYGGVSLWNNSGDEAMTTPSYENPNRKAVGISPPPAGSDHSHKGRRNAPA